MHHGYLCLVLHAHLPFVKHLDQRYTLEEQWFFEAITETYVPLLQVLHRWQQEGIRYKLTMTITPTLATMLDDDILGHRYELHLESMLALAKKEMQRNQNHAELYALSHMYYERLCQTEAVWHGYGGKLLRGFMEYQQTGNLHILASAATHGYLPLMSDTPEMAKAQIEVGIEAYRRAFGCQPRGFWLPECAFLPGHDRWLAQQGIVYTFTDGHALLHADAQPRYGVYAPLRSPAGVHFFGRDGDASKQVWSADEGYPGDYDYREYYRDIGHDLPWELVEDHLPHGIRVNTGFKYHRITGKTSDKAWYHADRARSKAALHAGNFVFNRERQVEYLHAQMGRPPIIVAPYDAELFGHWWYEGPLFLDALVRRIAETPVLELVTPDDYLAAHPANQQATPSASSWGLNGYSEVWLSECNDWIYRHFAAAADRMLQLTAAYGTRSPLQQRATNQAARELLLAQSSDWAFIMKTGTMVPYAERRTKEHLAAFLKLHAMIQHDDVDEPWLHWREVNFDIYPWLEAPSFYETLPHHEREGVPSALTP